ncbi:hypothetical protein BGX31_006211 [Mortierella sp. GBA43]|nr:hypothetical protein BGX31_006211 [Mortierella sp. GBA43]
MDLDEILEVIFSFMSQHTLRTSTSLVCKRWLYMSRKYRHRHGLWQDHFLTTTFSDDPTAWITDIEQHHTLFVRLQPDSWGTRRRTHLTPAEKQVMERLRQTPPKRHLHTIMVQGGRQLDIGHHWPLLPYFRHIRTLRLEFVMQSSLDLAEILRCCNLLETLYLRTIADGNTRVHGPRPNILTFQDSTNSTSSMTTDSWDAQGSSCSLEGMQGAAAAASMEISPLRGLRLRRFEIHDAQASLHTLCALVDAVPELRIFIFHAWEPARTFIPLPHQSPPPPALTPHLLTNPERRLLYGRIANACPFIRHVRYSVPGRAQSLGDIQSSVMLFPHVDEWSFNATDLTLGITDDDNDEDEDGGFGSEMAAAIKTHFGPSTGTQLTATNSSSSPQQSFQISPAMTRLRYLCHTVNRLSSLEIQTRVDLSTQADRALARALHFFLCSSPSLVHLRAPKVVYPIEYLNFQPHVLEPHPEDKQSVWWSSERPIIDFWNQSPRDEEQQDEAETAPSAGQERCRPIWACRGLQTLHLGFQSVVHGFHPTNRARILFGYLSLVCPQLRDLSIRSHELDLGLEGGMAMLARLRWLEQLKIQVDAVLPLADGSTNNRDETELVLWWLKLLIVRRKNWRRSKIPKTMAVWQLRAKLRKALKKWRQRVTKSYYNENPNPLGSRPFPCTRSEAELGTCDGAGVTAGPEAAAGTDVFKYYDGLDAMNHGEMAIIQDLHRVQDERTLLAFTRRLFKGKHTSTRIGNDSDNDDGKDCVWPRLESMELMFSDLYRSIPYWLVAEFKRAMRDLRPGIRVNILGRVYMDQAYE